MQIKTIRRQRGFKLKRGASVPLVGKLQRTGPGCVVEIKEKFQLLHQTQAIGWPDIRRPGGRHRLRLHRAEQSIQHFGVMPDDRRRDINAQTLDLLIIRPIQLIGQLQHAHRHAGFINRQPNASVLRPKPGRALRMHRQHRRAHEWTLPLIRQVIDDSANEGTAANSLEGQATLPCNATKSAIPLRHDVNYPDPSENSCKTP